MDPCFDLAMARSQELTSLMYENHRLKCGFALLCIITVAMTSALVYAAYKQGYKEGVKVNQEKMVEK